MKILDVYIEHATHELNRPFSYVYFGNKKVEKGYRVIVPFGKQKQIIGFVSDVKESSLTLEEFNFQTGFDTKEIIDVLDEERLLNENLWTLAKRVSEYYFAPLISVFQTMLPPSIKPKSSSLKGPKIAYECYVEIIDSNEDGLTDKQIEWLRLVAKEGQILKRDFKSKSILEKLLEQGKVQYVFKEKNRLIREEIKEEKPHILTDDQKRVINEFLSSSKDVFLLEGVTGSGKTEVYVNLAEHYLNKGKSVLFLVPEIALTPMMIAYFEKRFNKQTAILHSELTPAQKYDEYRRIARGDARIVIGARSAIFAPLKDLGLIILDEEHVETYKQENTPCYHAREVAKFRGEIEGAKVILGSATPSLESKARALRGVYQHLSLPKRIFKSELPKTTIVNLLDSSNLDRDSVLFSLTLRRAIKETLDRNEQVVLLLNRRGYSPYVTCRECGHVFKCDNCDITLTYHREDNMLKCHHCDHVETYPSYCPDCGSTYLSKQGFGTERIEEEIKRLFPSARTLRLDSDVSRVRLNIEKILEKFRNQEADILIGTQMIAKGHDFPNVTLVGIVLADIGLTMPSYRSSERTFQLITQGVGRAGRGIKGGQAIIQTYMPTHYAVTLGAAQDYGKFFVMEMNARKLQRYSPYMYLTSLQFLGKDEEEVELVAQNIKDRLAFMLKENVILVGPSSPYIKKKGEYYLKNLLLKYKDQSLIEESLTKVKQLFEGRSDVRLRIDRDPFDY